MINEKEKLHTALTSPSKIQATQMIVIILSNQISMNVFRKSTHIAHVHVMYILFNWQDHYNSLIINHSNCLLSEEGLVRKWNIERQKSLSCELHFGNIIIN